jgi:hypothetical protein
VEGVSELAMEREMEREMETGMERETAMEMAWVPVAGLVLRAYRKKSMEE